MGRSGSELPDKLTLVFWPYPRLIPLFLGACWLLGGLGLLMGWLMPGIGNAAHLGGLLVGTLAGLERSPGLRRWVR